MTRLRSIPLSSFLTICMLVTLLIVIAWFFTTEAELSPLLPFSVAMAIPVKGGAEAAKRFVQRAQAATGEYTSGVKNAGPRWQAAAEASKDNFAAGVQQAIAQDRYAKGVRDAGSARYQERAEKIGSLRFGQGVATAENEWLRNTQPFLQSMAGLDLPPRGPKGSPQNLDRVRVVTESNRRLSTGS